MSDGFGRGLRRACLLALLLLCVQQLALTHVFEHLASASTPLLSAGDNGDCPECLALGGLNAGGTVTATPWSAPPPNSSLAAWTPAAGPTRRAERAHAIRAPPENRN